MTGQSPVPRNAAINPGAFRLALASVVVLDHFFGVLLGRAAVYVFFVLSGYWITKMWSDRYAGTARPYLTYMVSRFWRLAPIMLTATAISLVVTIGLLGAAPLVVAGADPAHQVLSHLFFLGYSQLPEPRLLYPAWSLDIEMRFYIVAPLLVFFMNRHGALALALLVLALALARHFLPGIGLHYLTLFACGMIAAKRQWRPSRTLALSGLLGITGVFMALALTGQSDVLTDRSLYDANTTLCWVLAALAFPYAIATCHEPSGPGDRTFGDLSYSFYLVHWPMVLIMRADGHVTVSEACLWILASLVLAFAALELIDKPVQKWRARWVSSQSAPGKPEPAF